MSIKDNYLRPQTLNDFFGQSNIIEKLKVFIYSAKKRKTVLDHILLYGPPGLGKTSLAYVIANEMGVKITTISASAIKELPDLVNLLACLNPGDILFIDEIHNLDQQLEEILYSALEDFRINITYKSEENSKALSIELSPFTLIGATTLIGNISIPLRDRFGILFKFNYYNDFDLKEIILNNAKKFEIDMEDEAAYDIALRSRKTPRVANNILKRMYDYALFKNYKKITRPIAKEAFNFLNINQYGLNEVDIEILNALYYKFHGQAVSLEAIAAILNDNVVNLRDVNEPYLVNTGLIDRTKQGRIITKIGEKIILEINQIKPIN
jgi:Holliday junction DNA helicase RuvB